LTNENKTLTELSWLMTPLFSAELNYVCITDCVCGLCLLISPHTVPLI